MKIKDLDFKCGECSLIDFCASEAYGFAICQADLGEMTTDEYKKLFLSIDAKNCGLDKESIFEKICEIST